MPGLPQPRFVQRSRMSRQLEDHISHYGKWFVYLRTDQRFHCSCWDPATDSPITELCPDCIGSRWKVRAERMKAFLSAPENISSLVTTINIGDWGRLDQYPGVLYAHWSSKVQIGDLIFDVPWDRPAVAVANGGRITGINRGWKIATLVPVVFNDDSAVDYYLLGLEQHNVQALTLTPLVKKLPLITQFLPNTLRNESYNEIHSLGRASRLDPGGPL